MSADENECNDPRRPLSEVEVAHVRAALDSIEAAQRGIEHARQQLCSIIGFSDQWSDLATVHQTVKSGWYDVHNRLIELMRPKSGQNS